MTSVFNVCLLKGIRKPDSMTTVTASDVMLSGRHCKKALAASPIESENAKIIKSSQSGT
jgi:hypothetical protein